MPIDLEMLLSASNHAFYPYSSYDSTSYNDSTFNSSLSFPQNHCVPTSPIKHQGPFRKKLEYRGFTNATSFKPKDKEVTGQELFGARKKKVSFADDKGLKLVEVREIPNTAPKWADDVLTLLIGNMRRSVVKEKKWKVAFEHPPWSDEKLIDVVETNMVALKHVSVKEGSDDYLNGTVLVKNLAFQKNIFLRVTFDRWLTYIDIPCTYMKRKENSTKIHKYDTFYFNVKVLPVAARYEVIEFSVCFQCDGKEYWDSNGGINYRLIAEYSKSSSPDLHQEDILTQYKESGVTFSDTVVSTEEANSFNKLLEGEAFW